MQFYGRGVGKGASFVRRFTGGKDGIVRFGVDGGLGELMTRLKAAFHTGAARTSYGWYLGVETR